MQSVQEFILFFVIGVNQEKWKAGGVQDFVVVVVCQNLQVNRPNKFKHDLSDSLHYSIFFILFCYTVLCTDPHVNKDFFLFEFFSNDSLSCSKVGAIHV